MITEAVFLDRNENNYGPAPACYEVLRSAGIDALSRYSKDSLRGVKSLLTERLARDFGIPEPRIHLGYGSEDILKQAVQCYLRPGEALLIPSHSWWYYKSIARSGTGALSNMPWFRVRTHFIMMSRGFSVWPVTKRPRLVLISSPNNPTGNSLGNGDLGRVIRELKDTIIILDQAYWGFGGAGAAPLRILLRNIPA